jgi:hypothetical protein
MSNKMTLREACYISLTGYGPCSQFTLKEWLEAREFFRANQAAALAQLNLPKVPMN